MARRKCALKGCTKQAVGGGTQHCVGHGGGKRCQQEDAGTQKKKAKVMKAAAEEEEEARCVSLLCGFAVYRQVPSAPLYEPVLSRLARRTHV
jgi:hypothetical protein